VLRHEGPTGEDQPVLFLPGTAAEYKPEIAGGGSYIRPQRTGVWRSALS
jgi:hypothetical protein